MGTGLAACTDTSGGGSGNGGFEKAVGSLTTGQTKEGNAPPAVRISENAKLPEGIRPRGGLAIQQKKC